MSAIVGRKRAELATFRHYIVLQLDLFVTDKLFIFCLVEEQVFSNRKEKKNKLN
jgi:hypothetical protein